MEIPLGYILLEDLLGFWNGTDSPTENDKTTGTTESIYMQDLSYDLCSVVFVPLVKHGNTLGVYPHRGSAL
jgi:hypothetical protein